MGLQEKWEHWSESSWCRYPASEFLYPKVYILSINIFPHFGVFFVIILKIFHFFKKKNIQLVMNQVSQTLKLTRAPQ